MSVRRGVARLAVLGTLLAGLGLFGASPAAADEDVVQVNAASSFTAGGPPGEVSVAVVKHTDGCVTVRGALGIQLAGLTPDQVRIAVAFLGRWRPLSVRATGDGAVATGRVSPEKPTLCKGRSTALRYRVAFLSGAPAGQATIVATAHSGLGKLIGRGAGSAKVINQLLATASPTPSRSPRTPTPTPTPTPAPTPEATGTAEPEESVAPVEEVPTTSPVAAMPVSGEHSGGGLVSTGSLVMLLGVGMVGLGLVLLVLLLRRNRARSGEPGGGYPGAEGPTGGGHPGGPPPPPTGGGDATMVLPQVPNP